MVIWKFACDIEFPPKSDTAINIRLGKVLHRLISPGLKKANII